jgi:Transcription factor WhiB
MTTPAETGSAPSPLPTPPEWTRRASCLDRADLEWVDPDPEQTRRCCAICVDCPVRRECLATALIAAEPWGIWGGLDAGLARASGLPVPAVLPMHGFRARYAKHGCRCRACRQANTTYIGQRRRKTTAA